MRGLYIHIPFCKHICSYCDFPKRITKDKMMLDNYITRLLEEFYSYSAYFDSIRTIYIGGGTPSILDVNTLDYLLNKISIIKNISEFTFEANPESLNLEKIKILKKYGVNRISMGVESFDDNNLKILNRKHRKDDVLKKIELLKENNITNINIDLIFSIPNETIQTVKNDLKEFYKLNIPHISFYSLILEEKTLLYHLMQKNELNMVSNDLEAKMYKTIISDLKAHGYNQYEISNFCLNGFESAHNKIYWNNQEYIGIGAGASGYLDKKRYYNNYLINEYMLNYIKTVDYLTENDRLNEELMLGLRLTKGIEITRINEKYGVDILEKYDFKKFIKLKYLIIENGFLRFTQLGMMMGNEVFELFV